MSDFRDLLGEIEDGISGKNEGISMGFPRLNNHISIREAIYTQIGGFTGSGKTSFVDDAFVLNPLETILFGKEKLEKDLEIIYFSMERRKNFKLAKFICRSIFKKYGLIIPIKRMLGWVTKSDRLTKDEHDIVLLHEEYIDAIMSKIHIISGPQNPTGIRKYVDEYAKARGVIDDSNKYNPVYIPNNPKLIVEVITDTTGLTKGEKDLPKGKAAIDKSSEDKQRMRDLYKMSPVDVSQFNRDIANPMRIKNGDVSPTLEDFKETGAVSENADVVLALFDPWRYNVPDPSGYELEKLRDAEGKKFYRNISILKNSYGSDGIRMGLAFQPEIGNFREMKKKQDMTDYDYSAILDNSYFLEQ